MADTAAEGSQAKARQSEVGVTAGLGGSRASWGTWHTAEQASMTSDSRAAVVVGYG